MTDLTKRILVAIIGIPIAILIVYVGSWLFLAAVMLFSSLTLLEFFKLTEIKGAKPYKSLAVAFGAIFQLTLFCFIIFHGEQEVFYFLVLQYLLIEILFFLLLLLVVELFRSRQNVILNFSATVAGFLYITLSFSSLIAVRLSWIIWPIKRIIPDHLIAGWLLLSIFFSIWICDSAAYFVGKAIGRHMLFPRVSPKKTWEGAVAGLLAGIGSFILCTYLVIPKFPILHSIAIGIIVGTIGQLGDLAESHLKRDAGVKDSSSILPGHGGFLDRFDSIMFVVPVVFIYLLLATNLIFYD